MEAETASGAALEIDANSAWINEAFEAFARDVLDSPLLERHVAKLVDERTADIWSELADAWSVVAELRADLNRTVPPPPPPWAPPPPAPPTRLPPGTSLSQRPPTGVSGRVSDLWWRARNAPTLTSIPPLPLLARIGGAVAAATFALVLVYPHPGVVGAGAPAADVTPVYVPMPGTPEAPLPVYDVAIQPANDARFPTTTTTR